MVFSHPLPPCHSSFSSSPILSSSSSFRQAGSEMAISGEAVSMYFEEKLQNMFPGQSFPETPEPEETAETNEKEDDDTDDSEDDFIQPRRKRLKTEEKVLHIKWEPPSKETREVKNCLPHIPHFSFVLGSKQKGRDSLYKLLVLSHPCLWKNYCQLHYTSALIRTREDRNIKELHFLLISWTLKNSFVQSLK